MDHDPIHILNEMTSPSAAMRLGSEADLIRYFTSAAKATLDASVIVPPSDDAAVLAPTPGMHIVDTVDLLVEGVDFDFTYARPDDVGYKSVMVNVSDIAAMRAHPRWATIGLGMNAINADQVEGLTAGFLQACREAGVALVGGDITKSPVMLLSVNIIGEVEPGRAVCRDGAKDGMLVCVTGPLGGSYAGYRLLSAEEKFNVKKKTLHRLRRAHLRPKARFDLIEPLGKIEVGAMIDISDGFLVDLKRVLTASGVRAEIETNKIPILPETSETAELMGENILKWALRGGEDFELIICLTEDEYNKYTSEFPDETLKLYPVGRVTAGPPGEIVLLDVDKRKVFMGEEGFDHFTAWAVE